MPSHRIRVNGEELEPDPSGALFWPARRMLIVADLHLEKGSAGGRAGNLLPPYDTRTTLAVLRDAADRFKPARIVCLGDSFHDAEAPVRIAAEDRAQLVGIMRGRDWIWIVGNHDPAPPSDWGGEVMAALVDGPLRLQHEATAAGAGEISGHFHPKAAVAARGRRISARCFAGDGVRLILPSLGAYAGGLSVLDPAIRSLFGAEFRVWLLGGRRIHRFPASRLVR